MDKIGIICEYNPFHNGHDYHIKKIKEMFPDSSITLVMSGNFTQRGLLSILEKNQKADIAIKHNIDLVVELPFIFATQSADIFANAAISILKRMKVDYLVFGSECNNAEELITLAQVQLNNEDYNKEIKKHLDSGTNYPTAMSKAIQALTGKTINTPNDLLGLSYIKAIIDQKANIKPITIKRTNDFHSTLLGTEISSATAIREAISQNKDISNYVPIEVTKILKEKKNLDYFKLLKYKIITEGNSINKYLTVDEGIENRILKVIDKCNSMEELINAVKTKRYTYNKLSRMFIHILCSLTKEEVQKNKEIKYIRVLRFNEVGRKHLNKIKKELDVPLITTPKYYNNLLEIENKVDKIYNLIISLF